MCRFVSPMQHALFLFPVIPTLHRTVNQHQYKYYYQRLAEAMEKMGSSTSFREIYVCLKWTTEVMSFSSFVLSKKNIQILTGHAFVKKSSTLRISLCWIWKVFKVLNTFSMHCVPTSSYILFKLGFWTLRWKRAEILHFARGRARFFVFFTLS